MIRYFARLPFIATKYSPRLCLLMVSCVSVLALTASDAWSGEYVGERNSFNRFHGQGTYVSGRGLKYEGSWVNGRKNGKGTQTWPSGDIYVGNWVDNKRHGTGVQTWTNNDRYEGEWVGGKRTGKGVYRYANGNVYTGSFRDGQQKGKGELAYKNGSRFRGSWDKDVRHGNGLIIYADGSVLEGVWNHGKFSGSGTFATKDYKFTGGIRNGKPHGKGRCSQGTKKIECEFNNGKRLESKVDAAPKLIAKPQPKPKPKPKPAPIPKPASKPTQNETQVMTAASTETVNAKAARLAISTKLPPASVVSSVTPAARPAVTKTTVIEIVEAPEVVAPRFRFKHNWSAGGGYDDSTNSVYIKNARRDGDLRVQTENEKFLLTITINEYEGPGKYPLRYFAGVVSEKGVGSFATSSDQPGEVNITKDDGKIISGTFRMTLYRNGNASGEDAKIVNDGFFSVQAE